MNEDRRRLLGATAAAATTLIVPERLQARSEDANDKVLADTDLLVPSRPGTPTPGKPGDFDFLQGEWRIRHWRKPTPEAEWDHFEGEATCWTILGGVCSVEELRIPARQFSGMGLRLLDVERKRWSDHWVNAKSGVVSAPGLEGSFENGIGLFVSEEEDEGKPLLAAGIWDRISRDSCRWRQAVSRDNGTTWTHNWVMHWQRA